MKFFIILIFIFLNASEINNTKKTLYTTHNNIKKTNKKLKILAINIIKIENNLNKINFKIEIVNKNIFNLQNSLKKSYIEFKNLTKKKEKLIQQQDNIKQKIIIFLSQNYYINSQQIENQNDLIYTSLIQSILKEYSQKIKILIKENQDIEKNLSSINIKIKNITNKKNKLENLKKDLILLKSKQQKILINLKKQKHIYKNKLEDMLRRKYSLEKKLAELKIIKHRRKIPVITTNLKNLNVKKVGNAYIKPQVIRYRGKKTIPPVKGRVIKKFGSYIDPIYKIRIYNDSITIKTKPNALIRSIFAGKVIYIGTNNGNKIIFIKHKNNLFSIYSNLTKISPLIRKGSYVRKGQIIARVKDRLEFEVTYKDMAINPLQVINLR